MIPPPSYFLQFFVALKNVYSPCRHWLSPAPKILAPIGLNTVLIKRVLPSALLSSDLLMRLSFEFQPRNPLS